MASFLYSCPVKRTACEMIEEMASLDLEGGEGMRGEGGWDERGRGGGQDKHTHTQDAHHVLARLTSFFLNISACGLTP